jgi:hypothetical protein
MKSQEIPNYRLQTIALWASIVVAATAVLSQAIVIWNFNRNSEVQAQLMALGALQNYLNLAIQYPDLASHDKNHPVDARYAWFAANALNTAQTLRVLTGRQADWQRAIDAIIRQHQPYLRSGLFECHDFNPEFISYLRRRVADVKCVE